MMTPTQITTAITHRTRSLPTGTPSRGLAIAQIAALRWERLLAQTEEELTDEIERRGAAD